MRRFLAIVMVCVLALSMTALAESTRERVLVIGDAEQTVTETLHVSETGYTLWYPAELLEAQQDDINDCFYPVGDPEQTESVLLIVPVEIDPSEAESFFAEATGGYGEDSVIGAVEADTLDNGGELLRVEVVTGDFIDRFYMVKGESSILCITASFPEAASGDVGAYFDAMVRSIVY